jgi:lipopolysaccharide heptosyltransferase II
MLDFGIYLLYRAGSLVLGALPLRLLFSLGELLGLAAWALHGGYRRLAQRNLAVAFGGEKTPTELRRLARRHFQRLGANLLCSLKLSTMPLEKLAPRLVIENEELIHNELRGGRPLVVVLSHLGNWELFAQIFPRDFGYVRNGNIYQAFGNRYIDTHVRQQRTRTGVELFDRREGFNRAIELLRSGGVLGVMSDQHAGDHGLWTPFFGRLASTTPLAALLAKRTGAAVMTAAIYTDAPARWRMVFGARIDRPDDSVPALTAKVNEAIAEQIRRTPEDWFWVHNRWKTPKPNFLLTQYKRGIYLPPDMPAAELKPFRILIRATNWLGDSVISSAAVRAIKRGRPDAHITVAAPAKIAPVWKLIPEADAVLAIESRSLFATVSLFRRQPPFDVAIVFPNSLRSALEVRLAGIPRRVGYRGHQRAWLLNQIVPDRVKRGPIDHQVNDYLHIAQQLGVAIEASAPVPPLRRVAANEGEPVKIGLCPGAEYGPAKRWLPERFAEVATAVASGRAVQWILFGTAPDAAAGKIVAEQLGEKCVNRIGETTIEQLIDELRECRALLTNDTGTMHLATLLGVPVVAVFGSTEHRLTGPLGDGHIVIRHHVECSPCFLRECPIDFRCMKAVTTEEVTDAVLQQISASAGSRSLA